MAPKKNVSVEKDDSPKAKAPKSPKKDIAKKSPKTKNAYMLFVEEKRAEFVQKFNLKGVAEVAKKAGEIWKSMEESEKKPFTDKAAKLKAEYEKTKAGK